MKKLRKKILSVFSAAAVLFATLPTACLTAFATSVPINAQTFPDAIFRDYVSSNFDTNTDGLLSQEEIDAVTSIKVSAMGISDLTGISVFTSLKDLACTHNNLTELKINKNMALSKLTCYNNNLTELDIRYNTNLKRLYCNDNKLTRIDGTDKVKLYHLSCQGNQLTKLDVSENRDMLELDCSSNQLTTLDVSKYPRLELLKCSSNQLTELDTANNNMLEAVYCSSNQITELDFSNNPSLDTLYCSGNQLTRLNVSKNFKLNKLYCYNNKLTELDVSQNTKLTTLDCGNNQLTEIDIASNTVLNELDCSVNKLTDIDLTNNAGIKTLKCRSNKLTELDLADKNELYLLNCSVNQLSELDVSRNIKLTSLNCYNNKLTTLDVSKNTALTSLNCSNNQLTTLDVNQNTSLSSLVCYGNRLTTLDINHPVISMYNNEQYSAIKIRKSALGWTADFKDIVGENVEKVEIIVSNWQYDPATGFAVYLKDEQPEVIRYFYSGTNIETNRLLVNLELIPEAEFSLKNVWLSKGQKANAVVTPSGSTVKSWKTDKPGVATVVNGVVTAVDLGTAKLTAVSDRGEVAEATVTVTNDTVLMRDAENTYCNGSIQPITSYNGVPAVLTARDGKSILPLRYVAEANGFIVGYDPVTHERTVTNPDNGDYLVITVGETRMVKHCADGSTVTFEADLPVIKDEYNGATYVAMRSLCEALGVGVAYRKTADGKTYVVVSSYQNIDAEETRVTELINVARGKGLK